MACPPEHTRILSLAFNGDARVWGRPVGIAQAKDGSLLFPTMGTARFGACLTWATLPVIAVRNHMLDLATTTPIRWRRYSPPQKPATQKATGGEPGRRALRPRRALRFAAMIFGAAYRARRG